MHIILSWCISVQICKSFKLEFFIRILLYCLYNLQDRNYD